MAFLKNTLFVFSMSLLLFSCAPNQSNESISKNSDYLFYLHGRIIEDQGINAVSEIFGKYEYTEILEKFKAEKFNVKSEARPQGTNNDLYAEKIQKEIKELISQNINPNQITVVGASKGALIAMLISTKLKNTNVRFVLMGNCNDWIFENYEINLYGDILSIYEKSDTIGGGSCEKIKSNSTGITNYQEIILETGLGHGFLYRPIDEWIKPTIDWAKK